MEIKVKEIFLMGAESYPQKGVLGYTYEVKLRVKYNKMECFSKGKKDKIADEIKRRINKKRGSR